MEQNICEKLTARGYDLICIKKITAQGCDLIYVTECLMVCLKKTRFIP